MNLIKVNSLKYDDGVLKTQSEILTEESPLQIQINDRPFTMTMRSPGHDPELTLGLLYTEKIIDSYSDIVHLTSKKDASLSQNIIYNVILPENILSGKNIFNRTIASSASCGLCGKAEFCESSIKLPQLDSERKINFKDISSYFKQMQLMQKVFGITGGTHAASIFNSSGQLLTVMEDIGRHNAVDKTIGKLLMSGEISEAAILCVSGRVSYEIAAKCSVANIPFLLSVSAPSSMAVEYCQNAGITLLAFCRENRATVYSNKQNIIL